MSSVNTSSSIHASSEAPVSTTNPGPSVLQTVLVMLAVIALGGVAAVASVYFRRTQTMKTTEFWGPEAISAFQLAPMVKLEIRDGKEPAEVDLTGMPGLGHLRHALLEQRHYEWDTEAAASVESSVTQYRLTVPHSSSSEPDQVATTSPDTLITYPAQQRLFATLTFWDPRKPAELPPDMPEIQTTTVELELTDGWVGPATGERSVRLNERARPAVRHFLTTMRNVKQARYDDRPKNSSAAEATN